jgi:CRISPR-associated endonuclease/helicase Cas3
MSNSFLLLSHPKSLLVNHLRSVATKSSSSMSKILSSISVPYSAEDLIRTAYIMGATHDIGKSSEFFQEYIKKSNSVSPLLKSHSPISSLFCYWAIKNDEKISTGAKTLSVLAALGVQSHHGSLKRPDILDSGMRNFFDDKILERQINSMQKNIEVESICNNLGIASFSEFFHDWQRHFEDMTFELWSFKNPDIIDPAFSTYYLANLLFSILLDSDRLDAAGISYDRKNLEVDTVYRFVNRISTNSNLNNLRNKLFQRLDNIVGSANLQNRILSITAPTGAGKTLSSLNFALRLRQRIYAEFGFVPRIIYVAPFTSILDQNFSVFEEVFRTSGQSDILLLHHHLAQLEYKSFRDEKSFESYSTSQSELLISGWNAEVIVTTFVQFFGTVFGKSTHDLRRFSNMIGSIVILDEVQSIPFEYWNSVRQALLFLSKNYSMWFILMTATQPLIFMPDEIVELVGDSIGKIKPRVNFDIKIKNRIGINEFCNKALKLVNSKPRKSILIEMNTIRSAIAVYNAIKKDDVFYLSSQVIPKHRIPRIKTIKSRLESNVRTVLVSTQVIEAGVDLDFDLAVRDIAPIDSIVQTAGRVNRNGLSDVKDAMFSIYAVNDNEGKLYSNQIYGLVSIEIASDLLTNDRSVDNLVTSYFKEVSKRRSDAKSVAINDAIKDLDYDRIKQNFVLIDEQEKVPVFVEYDTNASSVWKKYLELGESDKKSRELILTTRRAMQEYMINISEKDKEKASLEEVNGIYIIPNANLSRHYREDMGFIRD